MVLKLALLVIFSVFCAVVFAHADMHSVVVKTGEAASYAEEAYRLAKKAYKAGSTEQAKSLSYQAMIASQNAKSAANSAQAQAGIASDAAIKAGEAALYAGNAYDYAKFASKAATLDKIRYYAGKAMRAAEMADSSAQAAGTTTAE